ncbi:hypothetical protein P7K49_002071 [Saguinus oedipus]|uniref:Uncharacterized protein n=1 Tax=Saguinus oedipus TaxID=9490 RepID=A0ABQ9WGS1_SAGOE|nr:hypothetical protein P7K49_002071 [Saguinus oedipus]
MPRAVTEQKQYMGKQPDQDENQRSRRWCPCLKGHTLYGRLGARASSPDKGAVVPCIQFLWKVGLRPEILQVTEGEEPLWCGQSRRLYTLSVFSRFCASSNHPPINILEKSTGRMRHATDLPGGPVGKTLFYGVRAQRPDRQPGPIHQMLLETQAEVGAPSLVGPQDVSAAPVVLLSSQEPGTVGPGPAPSGVTREASEFSVARPPPLLASVSCTCLEIGLAWASWACRTGSGKALQRPSRRAPRIRRRDFRRAALNFPSRRKHRVCGRLGDGRFCAGKARAAPAAPSLSPRRGRCPGRCPGWGRGPACPHLAEPGPAGIPRAAAPAGSEEALAGPPQLQGSRVRLGIARRPSLEGGFPRSRSEREADLGLGGCESGWCPCSWGWRGRLLRSVLVGSPQDQPVREGQQLLVLGSLGKASPPARSL